MDEPENRQDDQSGAPAAIPPEVLGWLYDDEARDMDLMQLLGCMQGSAEERDASEVETNPLILG